MAIDDTPFNDNPFSDPKLVSNPEQRCAVVLLIDTSSSMAGKKIDSLNAGVELLLDEIRQDSLASKRVELSMIKFGPVSQLVDFSSPEDIHYTPCIADGLTPMGEAIELAISSLEQRKRDYQQAGVDYYRPWIVVITDGGPTDDWKNAAREVQQGEEESKFIFFPIGVDDADMNTLGQFTTKRTPLKLKGYAFREMFVWLSRSLKAVSASRPGEAVPLSSVQGWAEISG